jgi:asparagine synthase (glutamine-hydrolysing)
MGFGVPLGTWFAGDLRAHVEDRLAPGSTLETYLDPAALRKLMSEHTSGRADHGHRIWLLLTLESWLRNRVSARAFVEPPDGRAQHRTAARSALLH